MTESFETQLVAALPAIQSFVERTAGQALLRFEAADDLAQGIAGRALSKRQLFTSRGEHSFQGWLFELARNYLENRRAHWSSLKRGGARVLRFGTGPSAGPDGLPEPIADVTGPSTFADRREAWTQAVRALAVLSERDRDLVRWSSSGSGLAEIADRLGISPEATEQARRRAFLRYRKAYEILRRGNPIP